MHQAELKPTSILRLPAVMARTGLARSTIYELAAREQFPRAVKISARATGWFEHEIEAYLAQRPPVSSGSGSQAA